MSKKPWGGRFSLATDELVEKYNATILIEPRLAIYDIQGSIVHAKMLAKQNIITYGDAKSICDGLEKILLEIKNDEFIYSIKDEDIHMAIEKRLIQIVGDVGKKLHTARSRNDQTTLDSKLHMRMYIKTILSYLTKLQESFLSQAQNNLDAIMPGFTHLQTAQPVLYSHYIMAYFWMIQRDKTRFYDLYKRLDECPLGSAALAGTTFDIDRFFTSNELGFTKPTENSIDSVSDRDHMMEFCSVAAICFTHFSRLCEELIIFTSNEYKFIELSDDFCTGSSIMPQKKNPDVCEKMRGKTARMLGNLMSILSVMKGLPLAYNTDMSEDKTHVYDSMDTLFDSVIILAKMIDKMTINKQNMYNAAANGFSNATDLADYLVRKGIAFRDSHEIVGKLVAYAINENKKLEELSLDEYKKHCDKIEQDIYENITLSACINARNSYGGTSLDMVKLQIKNAKTLLENQPNL